MLVATHDLETIEAAASTRAVMLRDGRWCAIAARSGLAARPLPPARHVSLQHAVSRGGLARDSGKDLLIEFRSREILYTTLFFAVSCVLVFAFGFVREGRAVEDAAAGILWVAIAFSGTLALGRAFERERQNETLRAC